MPQYQVDSERIQSSSAAVSASIAAIRQAVNGMYTNLNGLQDAWRGGAATQFTSVSAQWRAAQQLKMRIEELFGTFNDVIHPERALCCYYAEPGSVMIGFEA